MQQKVYLLVTDKNKDVVYKIRDASSVFLNLYSVPKPEITETVLHKLAKMCNTEYFYVINTESEIAFPIYSFDFVSPEWDNKYMHIWNNDFTVRYYNKNRVLDAPWLYSDETLSEGKVEIKNHSSKLYDRPLSDIVFISYDETNADNNFNSLKKRFPRTKRIHNVKGICEAHIAASHIAHTDMFFVVDADAEIVNDFDFTFQPSSYDRHSVHVWHSINPINDLRYGYGAVKLFPTWELRHYIGSPLDFSTSVSSSLKVIPAVSNITNFNTDPFAAWRSGFREGVKLSNKTDGESIMRLEAWCNKGSDRELGDFTMAGAIEGKEYGLANADKSELLGLINDFSWLEKRFSA